MLGYPPTPPPREPNGEPPDPPTPKVWVNEGDPPPLQPLKRLNTPQGQTLAGSSPRDCGGHMSLNHSRRVRLPYHGLHVEPGP